ncbi:uncharacterized protein Z519_08805 [Cladophialophora bantiana CBS 173.52]|uniref:Small ribosomal subunit protein uS4m n=1 Tax=Cladophialophora bantiana (strain ATCC 10958 / CBS 173.52 / CDC B-1940 / NIH 8579) TaxID=1442370 RepID=A0A0D2FUD8_CLAB1|nr:uncharacterized protein Z519_08805 [Cladophialophora bantiana CBS 173.52]KIW90162.1 hypothetical protein Z519_08805 [Cladophialophora bantiana CBS 173.52]
MPRKPSTPLKVKKNFLGEVKIRQSWNKYNLYNLARQMPYTGKPHNFFKQKWTSKSLARNYHGEHIREKQWLRMFDRRIRSVIPMDAEYLASNDGSLESAGRGSGLETRGKQKTATAVPYMQMTFAPMERRLDTAIFRAMFASSARQARQFVVHGAVKVNGKQMRYPGYLLNPGDMFQVEPERVMWATGAPKIPTKAKSEEGADEGNSEETAEAAEKGKTAEEAAEEDVDVDRDPREVLKDLRAKAKSILATSKRDIGAKRKQDLRGFSSAIKKLLSRSSSSTILTDSLEAQFTEIQHQLKIRRENQDAGANALPSAQEDKTLSSDPSPETRKAAESTTSELEQETILTDADYNELYAALRSMHENPVDDSKPYATPWMPREYMSAFAFIPRFLEVNHNICAAVYLRHPVARPGLAEVPSPYQADVHSTAFAWYLRRR